MSTNLWDFHPISDCHVEWYRWTKEHHRVAMVVRVVLAVRVVRCCGGAVKLGRHSSTLGVHNWNFPHCAARCFDSCKSVCGIRQISTAFSVHFSRFHFFVLPVSFGPLLRQWLKYLRYFSNLTIGRPGSADKAKLIILMRNRIHLEWVKNVFSSTKKWNLHKTRARADLHTYLYRYWTLAIYIITICFNYLYIFPVQRFSFCNDFAFWSILQRAWRGAV